MTRDRRILNNSGGQDILRVSLLENEEEQMCADVDIGHIISGGDKQRLPMMCRKCSRDYSRFLESFQGLRRNLLKSADALKLFSNSPVELLPPSAKKGKFIGLKLQPTSHDSTEEPTQPSTQSPEVMVNIT